MSRKRMIDPSIWQDEEFGSLSAQAKILFIGLFSNADDEGRIRANEAYLKSTVFMYDDEITAINITTIITEVITKMPSVKYYTVGGKHYIQLRQWNKYQKQHKDRIQASTLPPYKEDASDNVGQVSDNVGVSKVKLSQDKLDKDKISNNDEKNSDEFSLLKKSLGVPDKPTKGITQEFQDTAMRIIKALGISDSRKSAYFKTCRDESRNFVLQAFSFAEDYKDPFARDKMFFWKLNDLKKGKEATASGSPVQSDTAQVKTN